MFSKVSKQTPIILCSPYPKCRMSISIVSFSILRSLDINISGSFNT